MSSPRLERLEPAVTPEPSPSDGLDDAQRAAAGDMSPEEFRRVGHEAVDMLADYLAGVERFAVFPPIEPGALAPLFPASAPDRAEPIDTILSDYRRIVEPNVTHWQHPGFLAYFATTASGPGIVGEILAAGLGSNAMLWRTSPIATELEQVVVRWLRQALGLPGEFDGLLTEAASTSTLIALAAARQAAGVDAASSGLPGRDLPSLRVYASTEAHSSVDKACMTLGLGRDALVHVPTDDDFVLRPDALAEAIHDDRAAGRQPIAIVATIGTTSSTSIDPVAACAEIAEGEGLWLHVDGAYAGVVALIPDRREPFRGWERADSIVVNPHKWLFTPLDASLLLSRRMDVIRDAFSLVPEYLRTLDRDRPVHDYNEYTPQLGRRFRALKLWILLRYFGLDGLRARLERHLAMAADLAAQVDADPDFQRVAPVTFSTVCLRHVPRDLAGREEEPAVRARLDELNEALLSAVNRTGEVFLSHTRLRGRFVIRVAIGNLRTEERHVARAWELLTTEAARLH